MCHYVCITCFTTPHLPFLTPPPLYTFSNPTYFSAFCSCVNISNHSFRPSHYTFPVHVLLRLICVLLQRIHRVFFPKPIYVSRPLLHEHLPSQRSDLPLHFLYKLYFILFAFSNTSSAAYFSNSSLFRLPYLIVSSHSLPRSQYRPVTCSITYLLPFFCTSFIPTTTLGRPITYPCHVLLRLMWLFSHILRCLLY